MTTILASPAFDTTRESTGASQLRSYQTWTIPTSHGSYLRYMSCGRYYVHGEFAMFKLGGPLSVVKIFNCLSFHYLKWSRLQRLFHCDGALISCRDRVLSLACPGFALRARSFNLGPCIIGVSSRCWHSLRMPACSSFVLLPRLPIQKCETGDAFNSSWNSRASFLDPKLQDNYGTRFVKVWGMPFSEHATIYLA